MPIFLWHFERYPFRQSTTSRKLNLTGIHTSNLSLFLSHTPMAYEQCLLPSNRKKNIIKCHKDMNHISVTRIIIAYNLLVYFALVDIIQGFWQAFSQQQTHKRIECCLGKRNSIVEWWKRIIITCHEISFIFLLAYFRPSWLSYCVFHTG